jgi:dienelactone hydrolase
MRTIEKLIVVLMLPAVLWLFDPELPTWMGLFAVAAAIMVAFHARLEGMHWQMAPAYVAVAVLLLSESGVPLNVPARLCCAVGVCILLSSSLFLSWALPMFKLPKPTGKYPVGTRVLNLIDSSRAEMHPWAVRGKREVVVQLWYPAAAGTWPKAKYRRKGETSLVSSYQLVLATHSFQDAPVAAGGFPIIIFNPAWHGFRQRGTSLAQELASHGFVVAGISHPYNSSMVALSDGRVAHPDYKLDLGFSLVHHIPLERRIAMAEEQLAIQTEDCRFVLDELERFDRTAGHPLEAHLRMDRVGAYGYSFGGAVSMEFAREDARVHSALELDGVLHGSTAVHGLDKPFMIIDSGWIESWKGKEEEEFANPRDADTARMWKSIADAKSEVLSRCGGMQVIVKGIGHADFSDQVYLSPLRRFSSAGSVPRKRVATILGTYIVAFFRKTLCNVEETILAEGAQPFPEATLSVWQESVVEENMDQASVG